VTDRRKNNADHYYSWPPHCGRTANNGTQNMNRKNNGGQSNLVKAASNRQWETGIPNAPKVHAVFAQ